MKNINETEILHKAKTYSNRGVILANSGKYNEALNYYDEAILLNPGLLQNFFISYNFVIVLIISRSLCQHSRVGILHMRLLYGLFGGIVNMVLAIET